MSAPQSVAAGLGALAAHLHQRRSLILKTWRVAVDADLEIGTANSLPRNQFNDHIPAVLDAFEKRLRSGPRGESAAARSERREDSATHGLQRWQQGYHLREVTREWNHLQLSLLDELETYAVDHQDLEPGVMAIARRALAELCGEGVSESTTQHFALQKVDAEGQLHDLEHALAQLQELERRRAELWREAAHDLRGTMGMVANATAGLTLEGLPEPARSEFLRLLQRSVAGFHSMLDDVTSLARLQAGHERRLVRSFDAATLLRERVETLQGIATQRGLFLTSEGPPSLPVEGDAPKVGRIAQNLLLNALRYTQKGGVTVTWGDSQPNDPERWTLRVRDTGPGFQVGGGAPLAAALEEATQEARHIEGRTPEQSSNVSEPPGEEGWIPARQHRGEGIGLSIVKRLCEILDATLEMESEPGVGSIMFVIFPRRYPDAERQPGSDAGSE